MHWPAFGAFLQESDVMHKINSYAVTTATNIRIFELVACLLRYIEQQLWRQELNSTPGEDTVVEAKRQ